MKMTGIELVESLQAWKETIILPRWIIDDVKALARELEKLRAVVDAHLDDLRTTYDAGMVNTPYPSFEEFLLDQYPELAALDQPEEKP